MLVIACHLHLPAHLKALHSTDCAIAGPAQPGLHLPLQSHPGCFPPYLLTFSCLLEHTKLLSSSSLSISPTLPSPTFPQISFAPCVHSGLLLLWSPLPCHLPGATSTLCSEGNSLPVVGLWLSCVGDRPHHHVAMLERVELDGSAYWLLPALACCHGPGKEGKMGERGKFPEQGQLSCQSAWFPADGGSVSYAALTLPCKL